MSTAPCSKGFGAQEHANAAATQKKGEPQGNAHILSSLLRGRSTPNGQGKVVLSMNRGKKKKKRERKKNNPLTPSHQVRVCITTGNSCVVLGKQKNNNPSSLG